MNVNCGGPIWITLFVSHARFRVLCCCCLGCIHFRCNLISQGGDRLWLLKGNSNANRRGPIWMEPLWRNIILVFKLTASSSIASFAIIKKNAGRLENASIPCLLPRCHARRSIIHLPPEATHPFRFPQNQNTIKNKLKITREQNSLAIKRSCFDYGCN